MTMTELHVRLWTFATSVLLWFGVCVRACATCPPWTLTQNRLLFWGIYLVMIYSGFAFVVGVTQWLGTRLGLGDPAAPPRPSGRLTAFTLGALLGASWHRGRGDTFDDGVRL
jgi:hypothetical protein